MARQQDPAIREFILQNVEAHPDTIATLAARKFSRSRAGIGVYLARLIADGLVESEGSTRARRYHLKPLIQKSFVLERMPPWTEDTVWRDHIFPLMSGVNQNVVDVCQYGFTEMLNNVLDHSQSPDVLIGYAQTYTTIKMVIEDHGIGIFNKIKNDFRLADARAALLELSKGKLTSDRRHHSGEGIYFTSRMFSSFSIFSGHLFYMRTRREADDWLIETHDKDEDVKGTSVVLSISTSAGWTMREVFDLYLGDEIRFRKTHIPVVLGRYPGEQLVSRSQAKRILARVTDFTEVILDFTGVHEIGQAFADEIFRVFRNEHPGTPIIAVGTNEVVERMINHAQNSNA
jgi:anti-sigma regulatory factor (Ser/Thr protein kinase)